MELHEEREDAGIAVKPRVGNLPVAEEADERHIAEGLAQQAELGRARSEEIGPAGDTAVIDGTLGAPLQPRLEPCQHALEIVLGTLAVAPAKHDLVDLSRYLADGEPAALGIHAHEIAHQIVA